MRRAIMSNINESKPTEESQGVESQKRDVEKTAPRRPFLTWVRLIYIVIFMPIAMYCAFVVIFCISMSQSYPNIGIQLLYFLAYGVLFILPPVCAICLLLSLLYNPRKGVVCRVVALLFFAALSWPAYKQIPWELQNYWRARQVRQVVAALVKGNAERALTRANNIYKLPAEYVSYRNVERVKLIACAEAKEMMQKYDDALRGYSALDGDNQFHSFYARVYYKRGERERAFQEYCKFAENALVWIEPNDDEERELGETEPNVRREIARDRVKADASVVRQLMRQRVLYLEDDYYAPNFMPFKSYDEFLAFIEEEYAKCSNPEDYERAVNFWRETANLDAQYYYRRNIRGLNGMLSIPPKFALCDDQQLFNEWLGYLAETQRRGANVAVETPPKP